MDQNVLALMKRLQTMKNSAILIILVMLSGCASIEHVQGTTNTVINSTPDAIGIMVTTAIFGGKVNVNPEPLQYIADDINREGRIIHGNTRRNIKYFISDSIIKLFN